MPRGNKNLVLIAKHIDCSGEYCASCRHMNPRHKEGYMCEEFKRPLFRLDDDRRAERCADCHMAQRLANGERMC